VHIADGGEEEQSLDNSLSMLRDTMNDAEETEDTTLQSILKTVMIAAAAGDLKLVVRHTATHMLTSLTRDQRSERASLVREDRDSFSDLW
jgi:hypothetical protein